MSYLVFKRLLVLLRLGDCVLYYCHGQKPPPDPCVVFRAQANGLPRYGSVDVETGHPVWGYVPPDHEPTIRPFVRGNSSRLKALFYQFTGRARWSVGVS